MPAHSCSMRRNEKPKQKRVQSKQRAVQMFPVSPGNLSLSASEVVRQPFLLAGLPTGGGFRYRLSDDSFTFAQTLPRWPSTIMDAGRKDSIQLQSESFMGGMTFDLSRVVGDSEQHCSSTAPAVEHPLNSIGSSLSIPIHGPFGYRASPMGGGGRFGGVSWNVRRSSEIVYGCLRKNSSACAVRVLLIDQEMLNNIRSLAALRAEPSNLKLDRSEHSGGAMSDNDIGTESSSLALLTLKKDNLSLSSCKRDDTSFLTTLFLPKLQQRLGETLLSPFASLEPTHPTDADLVERANNDWLLSTSVMPEKGHKSVENLVSPGARCCRPQTRKGRETSLISMDSLLLPEKINAQGSAPPLADATQGEFTTVAVTTDSTGGTNIATTNTTIDKVKSDTRIDDNRNHAGENGIGSASAEGRSSSALNWQLPIIGVSVFPFNTENVAAEVTRFSTSVPSKDCHNVASTRPISTPDAVAASSEAPLPRRGENNAHISNRHFRLSSVASGAPHRFCHPTTSLANKTPATSSKSTEPLNVAMLGGVNSKKSLFDGTGAVSVKRDARGIPSGEIEISKESVIGSTNASGQENKVLPLFAVALSLPLVLPGNVQNVFSEWVWAHHPSLPLQETVIRNIISGVLQHLSALHQEGKAHGSVKATNVFLTAHVKEALAKLERVHAEGSHVSLQDIGLTAPEGATVVDEISVTCGEGRERGSSAGLGDCRKNQDNSNYCRSTEARGGENGVACISAGDVFGFVDLSEHIVLTDGYYARVEEVLVSTLVECDNIKGVTASVSCTEEATAITPQPCPPPLNLNDIMTRRTSPESDALHLFTIEEMEYIPPPECITIESVGCNDTGGGSSGKAASSFGEVKLLSSSEPEGGARPPPFRATNNTRNPICKISPSHDIWMVGMLAIQLADGGFPWWMRRHHRPLPRLERGKWSLKFASFVQRCVCADVDQRPSAGELLKDEWFNTVLLDEKAEGTALARRQTASHQQQQQLVGGGHPPLRRPCRRAFVDIMLEYHEFVEGCSVRFLQTISDTLLREGSSSFILTKDRKDSFSLRMSGVEPLELKKESEAVLLEAFHDLAAERGGDSDGDRGNGSKSSKSNKSVSTCRLTNKWNETLRGDLLPSPVLEGIGEDEAEAHQRSSSGSSSSKTFESSPAVTRQASPFFLGAISVALDACNSDILTNDEDAQTGAYESVSSLMGGSPRRPSLLFPGNTEDSCMSCRKWKDVMGDLLQAFLNMQQECRLVTDVWCASLFRHMRLDAKTSDLVSPLITEETASFFASADAARQKYLGKNGGAPATGSAVVGAQQGVRATSANVRMPSGTVMSVDVSPTAFNNYMLCKWCVTTSWALQQQQNEEGREYDDEEEEEEEEDQKRVGAVHVK